jgi:hypothetical protein
MVNIRLDVGALMAFVTNSSVNVVMVHWVVGICRDFDATQLSKHFIHARVLLVLILTGSPFLEVLGPEAMSWERGNVVVGLNIHCSLRETSIIRKAGTSLLSHKL